MLEILCRYKNYQWRERKFYVVDVDGPAILGLRACEQMHIVTINAIKSSANCLAGKAQKPTATSIAGLKKQFPDQFHSIGSFEGKASLFLKPDARPSIDAPRKCRIHLKARREQELDTMENDGIIRKIEHHTDWCSPIATTVKKDHSLRVCLDLKRLNDNIKIAEARVFSKMDAKAYWSIHIDEASQDITTFRRPFGSYCYKRLPFGYLRVPRHIPTGHGPTPSKSTRMCWHRRRCSRVRTLRRRARQEPDATNAGCQRGRSRIQFQEMRHQDQRIMSVVLPSTERNGPGG